MVSRYLVVVASLVMTLAVLVESQSDLYTLSKRFSPRKVCGRHLADLLSVICDGNYNQMKKSVVVPDEVEDDYEQIRYQLDQPSFPFRSHAQATRLIPSGYRRYTRGIIEECCRKACSYDELRSYCGPSTNNVKGQRM